MRLRVFAVILALTLPWPLVAQPIDVEDWVAVRSRSFVLRSGAGAERALALAEVLEGFRSALEQLAPELALESPVPTRILAFRDAASFGRFTVGGGSGTRVLGQFLAHPDGNFITVNAEAEFSSGIGIVLHEYVHYLVAHNLPRVPRWFNEGLAEYYSTFSVEKEQAVVGRPVERHLAWFRRAERIDIQEVLEASPSGVHAAVEAGRFYAVSWGLVHYLLSSGEVPQSRLAEYLAGFDDGKPAERFAAALDIRFDDLEERLRSYILGERLPASGLRMPHGVGLSRAAVTDAPPSSVLCDLGALALRLGDTGEAARLFDLALAYDPESAEASAGLAAVRSHEQRFEDADALFADAMEIGLRDARSLQLYGRHVLRRLEEARRSGQRESMSRLAAAAAEVFRAVVAAAPDFAEASALLGYVHLFGGLEPAAGVAPLERAMRALPDRPDVAFHLLQLEVRRGEFERAREIARGPLRERGGEEWQRRAEEEIERVSFLRAADAALTAGRGEEALAHLSDAIGVTTDPEVRRALIADLERLERLLESR